MSILLGQIPRSSRAARTVISAQVKLHEHMPMGLAHEHVPMGLAHEHVLMSLAHEHVLMSLAHEKGSWSVTQAK